DEILWKTVSNAELGGFKMWFLGAAVAGLTAFYIFRLIYLTFHGRSRVPEDVAKHVHESPKVMTVPLVILAFLSVVGGFVGIPHIFNGFEHFLDPVFTRYVSAEVSAADPDLVKLEFSFMAISVLIAFLGIGFAYLLYVLKPSLPEQIAGRVKGVYRFLWNKWYVDEMYDVLIVRPLKTISDVVLWRWLDVRIIDGFVNALASVLGRLSSSLRRVETGVVQNYALSIVIGVVVLVGYFLLK
ncbi:MAG: NADH-quinone oxidoreductase subunit L, partial [Calditrichaeota bacterium]